MAKKKAKRRKSLFAGTAEALRPSPEPHRRPKWDAGTAAALRPPPKLTLSEWADQHFYLSAESAAEPGRWKTLPYQKGILDAITDPAVERVSVMKSARVGYTKCINAAIGYYIHQDPCPILVVQPTVEDAEGYSKEEIAPMLRDCEVLAGLVSESSVKTSAQTILHKSFPGGVLSMVGANSGRGFRRVSRRLVIFDEVDGYPASAGSEGDPIRLGERRAEYYWNRKIVAGSTPLTAGSSRIEDLFLAGDRRRYFVPCPHCGHMDFLVFERKTDAGHVMRWPEGKPEQAHFECIKCEKKIEETHKIGMISAGEWRAEGEFSSHASFHIWAAYSLSPNATWAQLVAEYLEAKRRPETYRTFVNTVLGESYKERGEAPEWERLFERRETYLIGSLPVVPLCITTGVDVQKDRLMFEIVAWLGDKQSYSIDAGALVGDTSLDDSSPDSPWTQLDQLLNRAFLAPDSTEHHIRLLAIDSGYNTQTVYNWARRHPRNRVIACKGVSGARALVGNASPVDVKVNGHMMTRGYHVYPIGVDLAKSELYGLLRLLRAEEGFPPGYCHFPEYEGDFFKQLTAEHLVTVPNKRTGREVMVWHVLPGRSNHFLDCRVLARAAAAVLGIDRMVPQPKTTNVPTQSTAEDRERVLSNFGKTPRGGSWLGNRPGRGWFK
jgi:phage terminase large subunit GpA-like protein